jgi:hypothetical protein
MVKNGLKQKNKFKKLTVAQAARECPIPAYTLYTWVQRGMITLPDDLPLLKTARKVGKEWHLGD